MHITQGAQHRYYKYDSLSRLIRERQVEQGANSSYNLSDSLTGNSSWSSKYEYNSFGLITSSYDARGVQATFSYDALNRVTQISYSDSTPTAHYYYDSQTLPSGAPSYTKTNTTGRLLAATYGSGATGTYFAYDAMGRVVTQKQVTGSTTYSLAYAYNLGGLLTSQTYPSGRTLTHSYDEGGRLSSLSDGTTTFANSFSYAPHGGLTSETWGNASVHTMAFNRRLQPSQIKLTLSGTVQQQYDYSYGEFNTSTGAVDTSKNNGQIGKIDATIGTTAQWNQGFSYDELGRLTNVREHQGSSMATQTYSQSYVYDRYGNRTQSANSPLGLLAVSTGDYDTINNNNRFVSSVATYDAAGNILTDAKFRSLTYTYDANGRQKSASNGTSTQTQVYDCAGQRVQTTAGSTTRTMVYDAFGQNVAEYLGSTLEREHIYRAGMLLAIYEAGALRYVLTDAQGSTRAVLNSNGTVMARHDYLPFGEEIAVGIGLRSSGQGYGATDPNRQKYGLTERDGTTGLDHTWWRKYENVSGRWTSPDPLRGTIGAPQTFNAYTYAGNDPVNFIDPTGLFRAPSIPSLDPEIVMVPISFGDPITQGGSGGDGSEWVTLAVINRTELNQGGSRPLSPEELAKIRSDLESAIKARKCADLLKALLDEAAIQTGEPYRDIMVTFDNIQFSYGGTQGFGGLALGSFEDGDAKANLVEFETNFISKDRSNYIRTQQAQNALAETLHHVGTRRSYDDAAMANALNAILVRQGQDTAKSFSNKSLKEVTTASNYWHSRVMNVCSVKY